MERTENKPKHYQTFEDLEVYQVARGFRKAMYQVARRLPEQIKFMLQSRGSLEELLDDLNVCADERYLPNQEIESLRQEGWRVHKLINGYIRFLRRCVSGDSPRVQEGADDDLEDFFLDRFNPSSFQPFNE